MKLKICKIGNSLGASFPEEILEQMNIKEGDLKGRQPSESIYGRG